MSEVAKCGWTKGANHRETAEFPTFGAYRMMKITFNSTSGPQGWCRAEPVDRLSSHSECHQFRLSRARSATSRPGVIWAIG